MSPNLVPHFVALPLAGAGRGLARPLARAAVREGCRRLFGPAFRQMAAVPGVLEAFRRLRIRRDAPALLACPRLVPVGTLVPNAAVCKAVRHLPSGVVSVRLSPVPKLALPIALAFAVEPFSPARPPGPCLGLAGALPVVDPEAGFPERAIVAFVPLALGAPFFHVLESGLAAQRGAAGPDPVDAPSGAQALGAASAFAPARATGPFIDPRPPRTAPDMAILAASLARVTACRLHARPVGRAGATSAARVSRLVAGSGVLRAMLIPGETRSGWIRAAVRLRPGVLPVRPGPGASALPGPRETGERRR